MRFRHSVRLTIDEFSNVFKLLLFRVITGVVFFSLAYVILRLGLRSIMESAELGELKSLVGDFFTALVHGDYGRLRTLPDDITEALSAFAKLLGAQTGSIVGSIIGVCVMYLLVRYLNGIAMFALGGVVNDRMSLDAKTSFSSSFVKNIGQGSLYQLVYVPITFVYDVLSVLACVLLFFYIPSLLMRWSLITVLLSLSLSLTLILCLQALKLTFFSAWMPSMIAEGKTIRQAFLRSVRGKGDFVRRFAAYLISTYLIFIVNVGCGLLTLGSSLIITVSLSYFFLIVMQFVNYYRDAGKQYFLSHGHIAETDGEDRKN